MGQAADWTAPHGWTADQFFTEGRMTTLSGDLKHLRNLAAFMAPVTHAIATWGDSGDGGGQGRPLRVDLIASLDLRYEYGFDDQGNLVSAAVKNLAGATTWQAYTLWYDASYFRLSHISPV